MYQIASRYRRAKKVHICDFCGKTIDIGTKYSYQFNKEGEECWSFYCHLECDFLSNQLYDYIDPWDGIGDDEFRTGVMSFCQTTCCAYCPRWDSEEKECKDDKDYCIDKCVEIFKQFDFTSIKKEGIPWSIWSLTPKKHPVTKLPGED